jgi:hypothetical protein
MIIEICFTYINILLYQTKSFNLLSNVLLGISYFLFKIFFFCKNHLVISIIIILSYFDNKLSYAII